MVVAARNLFEAATARGRLIRQGDIACIVMDGAGAMVVPSQDLLQAQKWAQSRPPSGNMLTDRARFLDKITALVSRPGSIQATRGNEKQIERLARAMQQAGYDLNEWTLTPEMKNLPPLGSAEPVRRSARAVPLAAPPQDDAAAPERAPDPTPDPTPDRRPG